MQNLGISDPVVKSETWVKRLLWPSIRNDEDVHSITEQGLWLCLIVAAISAVVGVMSGQAIDGLINALFFALAGFGIRRRSKTAALAAFLVYALSTYVIIVALGARAGTGLILRVILTALLLANVRGLWLAASWKAQADAETQEPIPLNETWSDKLTDVWPARIWPYGRWVFYVMAVVMGLLSILSVLIVSGVIRVAPPE